MYYGQYINSQKLLPVLLTIIACLPLLSGGQANGNDEIAEACSGNSELACAKAMEKEWLESLDEESRNSWIERLKKMSTEERYGVEGDEDEGAASSEAPNDDTSGNESSNSDKQQPAAVVSSSPSTDTKVSSAKIPPFKDIVLVYERFTNLVSGIRGVRDFAIIRFDDGTFSKDITGVMDNGVAKSKSSDPNQWGKWRGDGDSLALKFQSDSFKEVFAANVSDPVGKDYKLDKCYTGSKYTYQRSGDVGNLDTTTSYNTFCFQSNGIFTHDLSTSNMHADFISSTKSDTAGFYEINGNVIRLRYGNDTVVQRFFGMFSNPDDPRFGISIGSAVFKP